MDKDDTFIPDVEDNEILPNSSANNDCRINCRDTQSLNSIMDIASEHIIEFADSLNLQGDARTKFISQFNDSFVNTVRGNILVNGRPWVLDKTKLTPEENEQNDDALLSKLSKKVADVAVKRKFFPERCAQILNMQMKHEMQDLKMAKLKSSSVSSSTSVSSTSSSKASNYRIKKFSEYCRELNFVQQTLECKLHEAEKIAVKINQAKDIKAQQKARLKTTEDNVAASK